MNVRVLLVDDEVLVRSGLRLILEGRAGIEIVGEAADGVEAIALVEALRPDLVLMDIRMPVLDGLAATERILSRDPDQIIVMLTTFDADRTVLNALRAGAQGFLLKDTPPADLVASVLQAADGRVMLSPDVTRRLVAMTAGVPRSTRRTEAATRLATLTPREREVAGEVASGRSNAEIAERLFLSLATVKTHVRRVMEKLPADNRVQIAVCVHEAERE
ncbi:response regulator transcription factor [Microbacterium betulae]|uniref:Response regulator transcription factor n=1 Tax=Microbacterium betulae TaxID=2981139 RepID=A0AA97I7W0_9MICO|nr:response regulator transcription factor [Microbacterium sp. AB]WOF23880.1 response regulator transcription factor [Microbacterium sp. AB]